jgi:nitroimidazol reductase NimA-like FMN-containing flavoprotein (pyridoxamine 5'-phosphate oxidase superfamily)
MFTLYHIKGVKWGCTNALGERLRMQGYTEGDVSETIEVSDIVTATVMEEELNKRDGYGWNKSQNYMRVVEAGRKRGPFKEHEYKKGGLVTGHKLVEDGKWDAIRKNGVKKAAELKRRAVIVFHAKSGEMHSEWDGIVTCAIGLGLHRATINKMLRVTEGKIHKHKVSKTYKGFTFQYKTPQ